MRAWLYQSLINHAPLTALVGDRIYQTSRITKVPDQKPYIIYRMGLMNAELSTEEQIAATTPIQIFAYDDPGDYLRSEAILAVVKALLLQKPPAIANAKFIACRWLEDSEDLPEDPVSKVIGKFSRLELVHRIP